MPCTLNMEVDAQKQHIFVLVEFCRTRMCCWILSQSIACCVRRGPYINGRPGDRISTSPTLLNEFNWEYTEHARLWGVRWRVFVAYCLMACLVARCMTCIRSTLLMIIPEEPEYTLLWLSDCEWNQLDGREAGLDLIIGDFGEM